MEKRIEDLPDYPALKKLASALWHQDSSYQGAAVMVGAGFSRSAATTIDANKKLPLWHDLSSILAQDLNASANSDPLRLAEEYLAYFGKQVLHDLIKREINDAAWKPGNLHKSLLELPWSEVLTTNWDTLLERTAAANIDHPTYHVVSKQEDLSSSRSPRIVKLHGTVNVTEDLIFTQEDYRRYPREHAAFVNFTRQVFIENELCLLGFSGDDPNFLQWAGWVRDQLSTHARRIYLVGALHLTAAKRKYLESLNVAPIDLSDLVADYDDRNVKHSEATAIFLRTLEVLKPKALWEWSPTRLHRSTFTTEEMEKTHKEPNYAAQLLEQQIPKLEEDRKSYPGWLICPASVRWELSNQINDPYPNAKNIAVLAPDSRAKLLYEIAWRYRVTFEIVSPWLVKEFLNICDPAIPCALSKKQQMELALLLLNNTRWMDDVEESLSIEKTTTAILEQNLKHWPECADELAFHEAILARDRFDYPAIEECIQKISAKDPIRNIKKSVLLAELGRFEDGEALIADSYRELLDQFRNNRNSIYIFSRVAWAHWLLRGTQTWKVGTQYEPFPSSYKDKKCSPWDHMEHLKECISKALEQQQKQEIEPSFEPGRYKDNSDTITFGGGLHPISLLDAISSHIGMPLQWNHVNFLIEQASTLVRLNDVDNFHKFPLALRAASSETSDTLKHTFSRHQMACIPEFEAHHLQNRCVHAINYWLEKRSTGTETQQRHAISRLRVFIEVLARVLVRATPEQAKDVFQLAMRLGKNPSLHHFWLFDALKHLIDYAIKSFPQTRHHELLIDALLFPLKGEIGVDDHEKWPNPIIEHPGDRPQSTNLDRRIDEIIDHIAPCSPASSGALLRLLPLIRSSFLTQPEQQKIAEKIWGSNFDFKVLPETGLFKYVLLTLPSPDKNATKVLVRKFLFEETESLFNSSLLLDICNAAQAKGVKERPSESQAIEYFNQLIKWRPSKNDSDPFRSSTEKELAELIGEALSKSVIPSLPTNQLTEENFEKLCSFYSEVNSPDVVIGFPYFHQNNSKLADRIEKTIRIGLQDNNQNKVSCCSFALLKWRELAGAEATAKLISRLIYLIESGRMVGLASLLWTAREMYNKGWLNQEQMDVLIDSIPPLLESTSYDRIHHTSREAVTNSFARAACVRLAKDFMDNGQDKNHEFQKVLEDARRDPLPEVRFAELSKN